VSALQYLVKPFRREELFKALDKARILFQQKETGSLLAQREGQYHRIPYIEILYLQKSAHYFDIHTHSMGEFRVRKSMESMLAQLDKRLFVACHRSTIVNITHVSALVHNEVAFKLTDKTLTVSPPYRQAVRVLFLNNHRNKNISSTGDAVYDKQIS
jgi:DNA-binding LytR/AlgR family response regulator